jgi:hypothetical protein
MLSTFHFDGGLQKLSHSLSIERFGCEHQAGSDALLTAELFFAARSKYFSDGIDETKFNGILYGLTTETTKKLKQQQNEQEEQDDELNTQITK